MSGFLRIFSKNEKKIKRLELKVSIQQKSIDALTEENIALINEIHKLKYQNKPNK